jgi:hypothetical protein
MFQVFPQRLQDAFGRFLFQPLEDEGSSCSGLRLEKQVEMVRHWHPPDQQELELLAHPPEPLDKAAAKTF